MINLPASSFEFYDAKTGGINIINGEYEVYYGTSSSAKDLKSTKLVVK